MWTHPVQQSLRYTQSNKRVWLFHSGRTDKLRFTCRERGRSQNPHQTDVYFHSAGLSQQSSCTSLLTLTLCAFLQQFEAKLFFKGEASASTKKSKHKRTAQEKLKHAAMKDKVRRGGRNHAKTGEKSLQCFLFSASLSLFVSLVVAFSSSFFFPPAASLAGECEEGGRFSTALLP